MKELKLKPETLSKMIAFIQEQPYNKVANLMRDIKDSLVEKDEPKPEDDTISE